MANRICCTAMTGRIMMGRTNAAGNAFVGQKTDVTSDVLKAVIDKAAFHGGSFEIAAGEEKWDVAVTKVGAAPAAAVAPAELALPDVEDMAHSALQEALSFGLGHDVLHRWMRAVMDKTVAAMGAAAPTQEADPWEDINTLPNCDDPVWLYCQDTNTIDGPVAPRPHMAEDWTHWCPAEAPSTQAIDAARARQEGGGA